MLKKLLGLSFIAGIILSCNSKTPQLGKDSIDEVIKAMTLDEKIQLLAGMEKAGFSGDSAIAGKTHSLIPGAAGATHPIPRLGIPAIVLANGPAGLQIDPEREGDSLSYYCTAFPVGMLLASTWDTDLVENVGKAIGNEVLEYGVDVLLCPDLNIQRNPLCDSLLAGKTAAALVSGIQSNGVGTAVKDSTLSKNNIDRNVKRLLELIVASPSFKGYKFSNNPNLIAHAEVDRQSAADGMVLLKNEQTLPLPAQTQKVAAFGVASYDFITGGTVNKAYNVSLKDGLNNADYQLNSDLVSLYEEYIAAENEKNKIDPDDRMAALNSKVRPAEMILDASLLKKMANETDVAALTLGRISGERLDRKIPNDFDLSENEHKLIQEVCKAYHDVGKKVVVILNVGGVIETDSWKNLPDAILLAWQAGQEGGNAVVDILKGKVNPSGKLPVTFPIHYSDSFDKDVSYPFGYGLSYTRFTHENDSVSENKGNYLFSCSIKNAGNVAGKEVVQLYISAPEKTMNKPAKELKAFAKTKLLQPGESQTIQLTVPKSDLSSFDEKNSQWVLNP